MNTQNENKRENDTVILVGIPVFNQVPLLQPYPAFREKNSCKVFLQDLANLVLPIICVFGVIALVLYIISIST